MSDFIRDAVAQQRARSNAELARVFGFGPPADESPDHPHPDVAPLWRARRMAAEAGDQAGVFDIEQRLHRIDRSLVPSLGAADMGAGRDYEPPRPERDMNTRIRSAANYHRAGVSGGLEEFDV